MSVCAWTNTERSALSAITVRVPSKSCPLRIQQKTEIRSLFFPLPRKSKKAAASTTEPARQPATVLYNPKSVFQLLTRGEDRECHHKHRFEHCRFVNGTPAAKFSNHPIRVMASFSRSTGLIPMQRSEQTVAIRRSFWTPITRSASPRSDACSSAQRGLRGAPIQASSLGATWDRRYWGYWDGRAAMPRMLARRCVP